MSVVALRKESVDRNRDKPALYQLYDTYVALRKESVDRNREQFKYVVQCRVALRKESVDRNIPRGQLPTPEPPSLSARRAWIEICYLDNIEIIEAVALRKESVDRNTTTITIYTASKSRSPQGERG